MSFNALKKEYSVLLNALSVSLFGNHCDFDTDTDWQAVMNESRNQAVGAIALDGLKGFKALPQEISNLWFKYASLQIRNNIVVTKNHGWLDGFMESNGIPYCVLKGAASEFYYPNPSLRAMGDVDFLVPMEEFEKASKLLEEAGFNVSHGDHVCHRVFKKGKMHLEMHFEPAGMPEGENRVIVEKQFEDIFEKSSPTIFEGVKFNNPYALHHGLVLLLHTYHHLLSEGVGLRHLCDWAVFVNNFSNEEFENVFKAPLQQVGLWRFAQILSLTACDYIALPYKEWMGTVGSEVTYGLICDIYEGGNFGRKDKSRVQQGDMISNRGKDGISNSGFWQLAKNKNRQAAENFVIFKKVRILYPFGFVFMGLRYAVMVVFGKRKAVDIKTATQNAENRKKIYSQFKLFEKGE